MKPLEDERFEKLIELVGRNQDKILQLSKIVLSLQTQILELKKSIEKHKNIKSGGMDMVEIDEKIAVAITMIKYGGSFVKALGQALMAADQVNTQKIKEAFSEYWKQYKEMALKER